MEQQILNLANEHTQQAISSALHYLTSMSPSNRMLKSTRLLQYRSSSNNRSNEKASFHNSISRCSLLTTKDDLVYYEMRSFSYQQQINQRRSNHRHSAHRIGDVQYSFRLDKSFFNEINRQRCDLMMIKNFVNKLIEKSIHNALHQVYLIIIITVLSFFFDLKM